MDAIKPLMELAGALTTAGPAALLLWLWWVERTERKELSAALLKLTGEQIEAEKEMTAALTVLAAKVGAK